MADEFCSECPSRGPLHALDCSRGRRVRAMPAQVITHPSALGPVLKASVEAAERGELPVQKRAGIFPTQGHRAWDGLCPADKHGLDYQGQSCDLCRKAAEREAEIETLRGRLLAVALRLARELGTGTHRCLVPESGTGKTLVSLYDRLKALGAEEE